MRKHWLRPVSNFLGFLLAPVAIPVILIILLLQKLHILKSTVDRSVDEVATYLENEINDHSAGFDWDDFISVPITDPFLDDMRVMASLVEYPLDEAGLKELRELLRQVRTAGI